MADERGMLHVQDAGRGVRAAGPLKDVMKTETIDYRHGDTPPRGFMAWDESAGGKRPGVLVVHEFWGLNQHARNQAMRLAKEGYVGFALDLYGNGKVAKDRQEARALAGETMKDLSVLRTITQITLCDHRFDCGVPPRRGGARDDT